MNDASEVTYQVDADGSWRAETELGTLSADVAGRLVGTFDNISTIAIGDLTSIGTHQIDEGRDTISHQIIFRNGGFCRLVYKKTGEVVSFTVGKVRIRVSHDRIMTLNPAL